jgi:hypothetical protein
VIGDKLFVVGGWKLDGKGTAGAWHDTALVLDLAAEKPAWKSFPQPFKRLRPDGHRPRREGLRPGRADG